MTIRDHLCAFGALLLGLMSAPPSRAVEFDTGVVRMLLNDYGRVRLALSAPDSSVQIDRFSLLAGVAPTEVFDCIEDAGSVEPAQNVTDPQSGDFELSGVIDNRNSGAPPDVTVHQNLYGWVDAGYALAKFVLVNAEDDTINVRLGSEILPQISGTYGGESAQWSAETGTIIIQKNDDCIGINFLNEPVTSLCFFDWYSGYNASDDNLWMWLNYDQFDTLFQAGDEGSVIIPAVDFVTLAPGDSTALWVAFAYGNTQNEMLDNISAAQDAYNTLSAGLNIGGHHVPELLSLEIYPNPFNLMTLVRFKLPQAAQVEMDIYDINGRNIEAILSGSSGSGSGGGLLQLTRYSPGTYEITIDGSDLASGVYIIRLQAGDYTAVGNMVLVK